MTIGKKISKILASPPLPPPWQHWSSKSPPLCTTLMNDALRFQHDDDGNHVMVIKHLNLGQYDHMKNDTIAGMLQIYPSKTYQQCMYTNHFSPS